MPSTRPSAAFEPIAPDFDLNGLVESTPNFEWVVRIHCDMIDHQGVEAFEKLVLIHVILGGKPLVVEGYEGRLDRWTFAVQWLRDNMGAKVEYPRDLTKKAAVPMTFAHYLNNMSLLANQWTNANYKDSSRQRIYLKDIDCPPLWHEKLQNVLPSFLYYLNESTGDVGGFGAVDEPEPSGTGTMRPGKGVAKAGDLMSNLPKEMRAENMMCYIGHEGTYTPAHREMCASLGQNIMVDSSSGLIEDGKPTRPGTSIWFMTETKERAVVSEYWLSRLGHDIEVENHFAQINAWKNAPFKTYVVEQKPGDFILIPPLAPHQVWNRGTRTMKVAWNRTTVETLEMALNEALPRARMVCRDEQYKNKAIIYFTLQKYSDLLRTADKLTQRRAPKKRTAQEIKVRQLEKDFRRLHSLYTSILVSESFLPAQQEKCEMVPYEGYITCSYCRCNIFNRFLTCPSCVVDLGNGDEDTYDICMDCYAMGRSCACISKLKFVEQFPWTELTQKHESWRHQILAFDGKPTDKSPMSIKIELDRLGGKRTLAQICQMELKKRPFRDIKKPAPTADVEQEDDVELDITGKVKKKKKVRRTEKFNREHTRCHIDCHLEPNWKQAVCSKCEKHYCYGILFRGYDMMPQDVLADPDWKCPSCLHICGCRNCRDKPGYKPYSPSGTMLGHNTKAVADARSVESLVDFGFSNISWIQKAGDDNGDDTRRLQKRRREADAAKAQDPQLEDDDVGEQNGDDDVDAGILRLVHHEGIPIDPALGAEPAAAPSPSADSDSFDENPEGPKIPDMEFAGRAPMAPQYVVPDGGIIRDTQHAYDFTEAITYDYPDPDAAMPPVPPVEPQAEPTGYAPAVPDNPGDQIAMINHKRKRNKVDESEKAYIQKTPVGREKPQNQPQKQRQSLVVKLVVNKEKLAEINDSTASLAQRALAKANAAPVVASDIQALNTGYPRAEGEPAPKKARTDQLPVERDDEFMPGRYRDRRKHQDGYIRPDSDADITRRQTRTHAVTYEDPSDAEEEFDEIVQPKQPSTSKLATMEGAIDIDSESDGGIEDSARPAQSNGIHSEVQVTSAHASNSPSQPSPIHIDTPPKPLITSQTKPLPATRPSTASSSNSATQKALVEAAANRKAKMAALYWMENEDDSLDDAWSEDEAPSPPPAPAGPETESETESILALQHQPSATSSATSSKASTPAPPITKAAPLPLSRQSLSKLTRPSAAPSIPKEPVVKSFSAKKVSAADWDDSDSSDDDRIRLAKLKGGSGWVSVNGHGYGQNGVSRGRGAVGGLKPARGRRRGRPPKY